MKLRKSAPLAVDRQIEEERRAFKRQFAGLDVELPDEDRFFWERYFDERLAALERRGS